MGFTKQERAIDARHDSSVLHRVENSYLALSRPSPSGECELGTMWCSHMIQVCQSGTPSPTGSARLSAVLHDQSQRLLTSPRPRRERLATGAGADAITKTIPLASFSIQVTFWESFAVTPQHRMLLALFAPVLWIVKQRLPRFAHGE